MNNRKCCFPARKKAGLQNRSAEIFSASWRNSTRRRSLSERRFNIVRPDSGHSYHSRMEPRSGTLGNQHKKHTRRRHYHLRRKLSSTNNYMNAKLKNIPWFIEGSDCAMLRVSPDDFVPANRPTVYVRLVDVLPLIEKGKNNGNES